MKVILIGFGNLAYHYARSLYKANIHFEILSLNSKPYELEFEGVNFHRTLKSIPTDFDFYFLCIPDSSIKNLSKQIAIWVQKTAIIAHCAGTKSIKHLPASIENRAVLWPLQSLSHERKTDLLDNAPLFYEASNEEAEIKLLELAKLISSRVLKANFYDRKQLHLAAVFANNFTNHLIGTAKEIVERKKFNYNIILPILEETINKLAELSKEEAQTGPAIRGDVSTMNQHLSLLKNSRKKRSLYKKLSQSINTDLNYEEE